MMSVKDVNDNIKKVSSNILNVMSNQDVVNNMKVIKEFISSIDSIYDTSMNTRIKDDLMKFLKEKRTKKIYGDKILYALSQDKKNRNIK